MLPDFPPLLHDSWPHLLLSPPDQSNTAGQVVGFPGEAGGKDQRSLSNLTRKGAGASAEAPARHVALSDTAYLGTVACFAL